MFTGVYWNPPTPYQFKNAMPTRKGGLRIYESMRRVQPDFFIHSGDLIYADGPLANAVALHTASAIVSTAMVSRRAGSPRMQDERADMENRVRAFLRRAATVMAVLQAA